MSRDWSTARQYGRQLQSTHLLQEATPADTSGDDILSILNVNSIPADSQPKKITISGIAAAAAPYVVTASGSARGPEGSVQFNQSNTLQGSSNFTFNGSGIYASGVSSPSYITNLSSINTISSSGYSLVNTDNGRTVLFTSESPVSVTVSSGLSPGFNCTLIQTTTSGQITIGSGAGVALNSAYSALRTTTRYSVAGIIGVSNNSYIVTGDITI